jgi:predicted nuclease of predicted toxin-antitoxin system
MRFYLDENLSPRIAVIGREQGLEITSWQESGLAGKTDAEQLAFAAAEGRCLVTLDYRDFRALSRRGRIAGLPHAGVLYLKENFPARDVQAVVEALVRYAAENPRGVEPYSVRRLARPGERGTSAIL